MELHILLYQKKECVLQPFHFLGLRAFLEEDERAGTFLRAEGHGREVHGIPDVAV